MINSSTKTTRITPDSEGRFVRDLSCVIHFCVLCVLLYFLLLRVVNCSHKSYDFTGVCFVMESKNDCYC